MNSKEKTQFTVITNHNFGKEATNNVNKKYHTNPLKEQFMRFHNNEVGHKFSVEDLLR